MLNSKNPSVNFLELIHIMSRLPLWNIVYNDTVSKDGTAAPRFRVMQGRQVVTVKVSTFIRMIRVLVRRGHFVGPPFFGKRATQSTDRLLTADLRAFVLGRQIRRAVSQKTQSHGKLFGIRGQRAGFPLFPCFGRKRMRSPNRHTPLRTRHA